MKKGQTGVQWITAMGGLALLAALIVINGCAPQRQWTRPGVTQSEFDRDAAQCRHETAKSTQREPFSLDAGNGHGLERSVTQEKLFEQCLFSKGYRLEGSETGR